MFRFLLPAFFTLCFSATGVAVGLSGSNYNQQDTSRIRQILYNGHLWRNPNNRYKGDPYFYSPIFTKGSVNMQGYDFTGTELRYDINNDEVQLAKDEDEIIILNREMLNSFSLSAGKRVYRFIKVSSDSLKYFNGYINELYSEQSSLLVKYKKEVISMLSADYLGEYNQLVYIFIQTDGKIFQIKNLGDMCRSLKLEKKFFRDLIKENKIKVTRKNPDSFVPLLKYYDSASR